MLSRASSFLGIYCFLARPPGLFVGGRAGRAMLLLLLEQLCEHHHVLRRYWTRYSRTSLRDGYYSRSR